MKRLKVFLSVLIILGVLTSNYVVFATIDANDFKNVEYSEDFKEWLNLSDEEKKNSLQPRRYDIPSSDIQIKNPFYRIQSLGTNISQRYSLKDVIPENLLIRNQMNTQSCWAFATLSALETNLALANYKKGIETLKVYDYSERHMEYASSRYFKDGAENEKGYNRNVGSGGNWFLAETYLTNGMGAIDEKEMPFMNDEKLIDIEEIQNKTVTSQVYDIVDFPNYKAQTDDKRVEIMNQIKQHIKNYGSVYAQIHGSSSNFSLFKCYNNDTGALYCSNKFLHNADHAISIIGWDDNYSIDNFSEDAKPNNNGAWIIRNSWGERYEISLEELREEIYNTYPSECNNNGWTEPSLIPDELINKTGYTIEGDIAYFKIGDNGLMYVSYEDVNIPNSMYGIVKATDSVNYENIYQYDEYYPCYQISFMNNKLMLANEFNKKTKGTEFLTQVALYLPATYSCKVYVNPQNENKTKDDLQFVRLKEGDSENVSAGYHTFEFASPIEITGDKFVVAIELQNITENTVKMSIETKIDGEELLNNVKIENDKCFFGIVNGNDYEWGDLGTISSLNPSLLNGDSTIKAFTCSEIFDESLKNIEIDTPPTKTSYFEGEDFDKTGMVVKANYNSKTNPSVILGDNDYTIENGENLKSGQKNVTIKFEDKIVSQAINVEKNSVEELRIKNPPITTEYREGHNFNTDGMVIEATFKDGTVKEITDYTVENGNNLKVGQTSVKITYGEKTVEQAITVIQNSLLEIKITKVPDRVKYFENDNFDKTGMIVMGIFEDGEEIEILDYTIKNGTNLSIEQKSVIIEYEGKTATQEITVEEKVKNTDFSNLQNKIKKVQAYFKTDNEKEDYILIDVEVINIERALDNDSVEYYYYLSPNANEKFIKDWVKIEENQNLKDKLDFTIDTRKMHNYKEICNEDTVYIYIKETAIKGKNQNSVISKPVKFETDLNIEVYIDNQKKEDLPQQNDTTSNTKDDDTTQNTQNDNTTPNTKNDNTIINEKLPKTGVKGTLTIVVLIISTIGIVSYIKYRKIGKYI